MRQGKAGQGRGESVLEVHAYRTAVEEHDLADLEDEQRQWRNGEDQQRWVDPLRHDDHRRRPQQGADGEEDIHAIGNPRQPAGEEVIALATGQFRVLAA
ncbi:hypothetical protein D3C77_652320 [compost metagenome]